MDLSTILGFVFGGGAAALVGVILKYRNDVAIRKDGTENTAFSRLEAENTRLAKRLDDEEQENARLRKRMYGAEDELARLRRVE